MIKSMPSAQAILLVSIERSKLVKIYYAEAQKQRDPGPISAPVDLEIEPSEFKKYFDLAQDMSCDDAILNSDLKGDYIGHRLVMFSNPARSIGFMFKKQI